MQHIDNELGISYNFEYNGQKYFYRKNLQGDIIGIYDSCWNLLGLYEYDAWGNLLSQVGSEILNINPFRYRGYYYDAETGLYYLNSRYYDPETGRFISPDDFEYLQPESINRLNIYAYCINNPINYVDPSGHFVITLSFLAAIGVAATIGAGIGLVGTFVGDMIHAALTGEWQLSSWETYLGNALGGAIGGAFSLIPGAGAYLGSVIGGTLGTFFGLAIGKSTGSTELTWEEVLLETGISLGINCLAAGLSASLKIPGITSGSHSWQQVFKAGFTKTIRYGFKMSAKTLLKEAGYLVISSMNVGFFAGALLQSLAGILVPIIKMLF